VCAYSVDVGIGSEIERLVVVRCVDAVAHSPVGAVFFQVLHRLWSTMEKDLESAQPEWPMPVRT
jgi:hypothetical protein